MNTNQLKKFAKEARLKLIKQIGVKLDFVLTQDTAELRGKSNELGQLRSKLTELGREQLIETVAYTWFNRIMALRFMDANGYNTPKVVTPLPGMSNPEILQNALAGNIDVDLKLDRQRLNDLIDGRTSSPDPQTEAFKLLLVASCNYWHSAMPFMFERISDYTELLLPDDLLSDFSIVSDIRTGMSDEDCQQEELIGWLYQFYISDKKDDVFEGLKKNIKITAENIPAATQLFTPRWIVRYMVENTLGKLWLTIKPESKLRQHMRYFVEAPEGSIPVPLPEGINGITDISFIDPCQGSGHILVYAFDLFSKIYEEEGYNTSEIPSLILEHNLFGIDIDARAAQLAAFALTMKARSYYTRYLRKPILPHVIALENINENIIKDAVKLPLAVEGKLIYDHRDLTLFNLTMADNLGALINIDPDELNALQIQKGSIWQDQELQLKKQAEFLSRRYSCVATNPPYLGQKGMNHELKKYVELNFPLTKNDLMACFMERSLSLNISNGKIGFINTHSWMFLSSYESLRPILLNNVQFESLLHLGTRTFPEIGGEVVQNASFVFSNFKPINNCVFIRLVDFENTELKNEKTKFALTSRSCNYKFISNQKDFDQLPGSPIAYWISKKEIDVIRNSKSIKDIGVAKGGMTTGNNEKFVRLWHEVEFDKIGYGLEKNVAIESEYKWFPYNKGGKFRKWFGNRDFVIDWYKDGFNLKKFKSDQKAINSSYNNAIAGLDFMFLPHLSWSLVNTGVFALREYEAGFLFDVGGSALFIKDLSLSNYVLGLLNSKIENRFLQLFNPTSNFQPGNIESLPFIVSEDLISKISNLVIQAKRICQFEQSVREISINFKYNPILEIKNQSLKSSIISCFKNWESEIIKLSEIEKEINKTLIDYLDGDIIIEPEVPVSELTIFQDELIIENNDVLLFKTDEIILQFISYTTGCFFGRYSIDSPGLILANQNDTLEKYFKRIPSSTFMPDEDNIIPVLEGEWFNDDIVGRFKIFLKTALGENYFEENLKFIEESIDKDIRKFFVKDFYNDHLKRYKKRPIYWMFSSPKGNFKALIYMHRYQPDLCSKMLNDYLQPFISKLEAAKQTNTLLSLREDVSAREKTLALKEVDRLELMIRDCKDYERTLFAIATQKITIDLDDGIKVNYLKFKDVLVPIKGLEKEED
jgi:type II restriction/modification system DNA methylase subunit YeeA